MPKVDTVKLVEKKVTKAVKVTKTTAKSATAKSASDKQSVDNRPITEDDVQVIISSSINKNGLVSHHLKSFDEFTEKGLPQIITKLFTIEKTMKNEKSGTPEDDAIDKIYFIIEITDVRLDPPMAATFQAGSHVPLYPNLARINDKTYISPLYVNAKISATAFLKDGTRRERQQEVKDFHIAGIPVMVRSKLCHTYNKPKEVLINMEEDPQDPGGYFIIKGTEWAIDILENRVNNKFHVFKNVGHSNEVVRGEMISKPGDSFENSSEIIIKLLNNGMLVVNITNKRFGRYAIPFYVIFRALGMISDKDIVDSIVYGYGTVVSDHMENILKKAFKITGNANPDFSGAVNIYSQMDMLKYMNTHIIVENSYYDQEAIMRSLAGNDENTIKFLNDQMITALDRSLFPHLGTDPEFRHKKLRFLGHLLHRVLLVEQEVVPSTDRDSYEHKRVHPAGILYAKAFKTQFNLAIVNQSKKAMIKAFKRTSFDKVPLAEAFTQSIDGSTLERNLITSITTGNKDLIVRHRTVHNRLSSQQLHRKNQLNVYSTLRQINTPNSSSSKQDKRSHEMRQVHPTYAGFLCAIQSADTGIKVGIQKQMAISTIASNAGNSAFLKNQIFEDFKDVMPLDQVTNKLIFEKKLAKFFVNGDWIGCVENSHIVVQKYRERRRNAEIDRYTTIQWDRAVNDINLWVDVGRLLRPLMIVYRDPKTNIQDIRLTREMVTKLYTGEYTIDTLTKLKVIEYVSPEEQENLLLAKSLNVLRENATNQLIDYTHCDIPITMMGLAALTSPFSNHNQAPRITYQTNQVKQTCGIYALNWPFRIDKEAYLQYYCENPLIKTFANKYIIPNGTNCIVAIMSYTGYNQEDSLIMNQSAIDRGMFNCCKFSFEKTVLDNNEEIMQPDTTKTIEIKAKNYSKLVNGVVTAGTIIEKNDVIIGKVVRLSKSDKQDRDIPDHIIYADKSMVYNKDEPSLVESVVIDYNEEGKKCCKVKFSSLRTPCVGDKFSSRSGQKGVIGITYPQSDMPYSENGIIPDLIMNPHALPSRMTVGQLKECLSAKVSAIKGNITDGTTFQPLEIQEIATALEALGYEKYGTERMYSGQTGEWIDTEVFIGPTYYQRLQKFVKDEVYSINTGPTCALTRQPVGGKASRGGLRVGEMEKDVLSAQGCARMLINKFQDDSDGFTVYYCRMCGKQAVVNYGKSIYKCKECGDNADIASIHSTYASNLLMNEFRSMGIGIRMKLKPYTFHEESP